MSIGQLFLSNFSGSNGTSAIHIILSNFSVTELSIFTILYVCVCVCVYVCMCVCMLVCANRIP